MIRFIKAGGLLALAAVLIGGCTSTPVDRFYGFNDTLTVDATLSTCLVAYVDSESNNEAQTIHTFLGLWFSDAG